MLLWITIVKIIPKNQANEAAASGGGGSSSGGGGVGGGSAGADAGGAGGGGSSSGGREVGGGGGGGDVSSDLGDTDNSSSTRSWILASKSRSLEQSPTIPLATCKNHKMDNS